MEEVPESLELLLECLLTFVVLDIHQELVDDAAETPDVRSLIITFFDERDFWRSVPS